EHLVGVQMAWKNKMDLSLSISFGSSLQVALFVASLLVFISLLMGNPLTLVFNRFELIALGAGALLATLVALDGESNWLEGLQLLAVYAIIALGFFFALVFLVAVALRIRGRLEKARWMHWVLIGCLPLSLLAINMGWTTTEVGRQPWVVQGLMRTSDGVSPTVSAGEIWATLGIFALVYLVLFIAWLRIFLGIIKKGPDDVTRMPEAGHTTPGPVATDAVAAPAGTER
ncbi:MAG TPA: cytochrome ubiquinol oxidase subunit I, partial [Thermoleophilia bacterium]|nr:cytochrome ubiquinol oxidase subunit I [Thermoleophilia bacterium]